MYLTRFRINTARIGARRLLSTPQVLHAAVMSSFAEVPTQAGERARVLWRIDHNNKADVVLYIVSPDRPDLTHLVEQAGWPTTARWETFDYTRFLKRLTIGDTWAFRLTANPVHSIRRKDGEPTKRTAHLTPHHQMRWLLDRQDASGFAILEKPAERRLLPEGDTYELVVRDQRSLSFAKAGQGSSRGSRVKLTTVTFDGRLRVTDPDAFRRVLAMGLGKAKAYGCGLMTLAPVR
ncbi:type I-E CRISPR-associated protein Cas6/Cse3/CasE [Streptomyces sparsogenes]|uniref:Cse3 family CRISPR-associated protein n=1 Tax=Streptomyces sparsogenes DSM 40356 TaxID=1331668 RepID=A0A1R1SHW2_9ACTN|nr:type I-E CRISPR-associated protein Cas6/Cse3/CasE [Streptomyces sparsogenes]OMI37905.1 Cse3 family CRISPR-associated protein [Streptomyces sparsogenes DSM 40356]